MGKPRGTNEKLRVLVRASIVPDFKHLCRKHGWTYAEAIVRLMASFKESSKG